MKELATSNQIETTLENVLSFLTGYARTLALLAFRPLRASKQLQAVASNYLQPLSFLSVSMLLRGILIEEQGIANVKLWNPREVLQLISKRVSDFSIAQLILVTLPMVCFIALCGYLLGLLFFGRTPQRKSFTSLTLYAFGFQGATLFLISLVRDLAQLAGSGPPFYDIGRLSNVVTIVAGLAGEYGYWYPLPFLFIVLLNLGKEGRARKKLIFTMLLVLVVPFITTSEYLVGTLPLRLKLMADPRSSTVTVSILSEGEGLVNDDPREVRVYQDRDKMRLELSVLVENATAQTIVLDKGNSDLRWRFEDGYEKPAPPEAKLSGQSLGLTVSSWSDGEAPVMVLKPGDVKWIRYGVSVEKETYMYLSTLSKDEKHVTFKIGILPTTDQSALAFSSNWTDLPFREINSEQSIIK